MSHFQFLTTADGSPTLILDHSEAMHNKFGAFSETIYIYYEALSLHFSLGLPNTYLSLGLGIGYNELILQGFGIKNNQEIFLLTFESEEVLKKHFILWLQAYSIDDFKKLSSDLISWWESYTKVLKLVSDFLEINPEETKKSLLENLNRKKWCLEGALNSETVFTKSCSLIFFDAYSEKTSPELWTPTFLDHLFDYGCDKHCVFTTYAAKGELNRALRRHGFKIQKKLGYGGKRESTLAFR